MPIRHHALHAFAARLRVARRRLLRRIPRLWRARASAAWMWAREPILSVALVLVATTAVARPFYVPSGSMEPTIQIGDAVLAAKFAYGYSRYSLPFDPGPGVTGRFLGRLPQRGDVVMFRLPRDPAETYVKRVIGLPGDRVQMIDGRLWINGRQVPLRHDGTAYVENEDGSLFAEPRYEETLPGGVRHAIFKIQWNGPLDNTPVTIVPAGHLFVMGDNRDNSLDSRVAESDGGVGFVPQENLIGQAEFVLGSVDFKNASSLLAWPAEFRLARVLKPVR